MAEIKLTYGTDPKTGDLVLIDGVGSGKTALICPYCKAPLTAKKGRVKTPHFAHESGSHCPVTQKEHELSRVFGVDHFLDGTVSRKAWAILQDWQNISTYWNDQSAIMSLADAGLINFDWSGIDGVFDFDWYRDTQTPLPIVWTITGAAVTGQLTVSDFQDYQRNKYERTLNLAVRRIETYMKDCPQTDLEKLRPVLIADWDARTRFLRHWLGADLYFLSIQVSDGLRIFKVGMTTQHIEDRIAQIAQDIRQQYGQAAQDITPLFVFNGQALLERYVLRRWQYHQMDMGSHREYFQDHPAIRENLQSELKDLGNRDYTDLERTVLDQDGAGLWDELETR